MTPKQRPSLDLVLAHRSKRDQEGAVESVICLLYAVVPINAVTVSFDLQAALREEIVKVSD